MKRVLLSTTKLATRTCFPKLRHLHCIASIRAITYFSKTYKPTPIQIPCRFYNTEATSSPYVVEGNFANFDQEVLQSQVPVIVLFYATWSNESNQLASLLEKEVTKQGGKVKLVKLNYDTQQMIASQFPQMDSVPSAYALLGQQIVSVMKGPRSEKDVQRFVGDLAGYVQETPQQEQGKNIAQFFEQAAQLFDAKNYEAAEKIYSEIANDESLKEHHPKALAGIAMCELESGRLEAATKVIEYIKENFKDDLEDDAVKHAINVISLRQEAGKGLPADKLREKIKNNPDDFEARYELAGILFSTGKQKEAIEELFVILRKNRKWNDDAAKKRLLTFLDMMDSKSDLAVGVRRRLANILF